MGPFAQMPYGRPMIFRTIPILLALAVSVSAASAAPTKPAKAAKVPAPVVEAPITVDSLLAQSKDAATKGDTELAVRLAPAAICEGPARTRSLVALGRVFLL